MFFKIKLKIDTGFIWRLVSEETLLQLPPNIIHDKIKVEDNIEEDTFYVSENDSNK